MDCTISSSTPAAFTAMAGSGSSGLPENETVVRQGEWNEYLLKVEGNRYFSRLNGVLMVDFTDLDPKTFDGDIALQLHSGGRGNMSFKDIYIRDLTKR